MHGRGRRLRGSARTVSNDFGRCLCDSAGTLAHCFGRRARCGRGLVSGATEVDRKLVAVGSSDCLVGGSDCPLDS